jgi:hypothetical protein
VHVLRARQPLLLIGLRVLLQGIDPLLTADLLHVLRSAGHGDEIVLVDCNFPAAEVATHTISGQHIQLAGVDMTQVGAPTSPTRCVTDTSFRLPRAWMRSAPSCPSTSSSSARPTSWRCVALSRPGEEIHV